jgi:branched-chain amino acid transport system permease protein
VWQQLVVNSLISASAYVLVGLGFFLVYRTARFFHFAHGAVFTIGAYSAYACTAWLCLPLSVAVPLGIAVSTILGCLMAFCVYLPLRRRGASPLVLLLSSLGMYAILENAVSSLLGVSTRSIRPGEVAEGINVLGARITSPQIITICTALILVIVLAVFLRKTMLGKTMRAVANDAELARVSGIDSDRVLLSAFGIGSALAGVAGILVALDVDMTPTMGMSALMMGVVAVIIGGVDSIVGVALGAVLIGLAQHFGVWRISSQWQDAIAFVILLAFLLFRPQGFLGKRVKKATA